MSGIQEVWIATFFAAFARTAAFLQAAPITGDRQLPARYRGATAAMIALAIVYTRTPITYAQLPLVLPGEILLGLAAGFVGRVVMAGAEAGGEFIGHNLGLGFAQTFDQNAGEQSLTTRQIALTLAGLTFLFSGGLEMSVRALALPPPIGKTPEELMNSIVNRTAEVLIVGVRIAAPTMIAAVVANMAMAMASRAAPALNAFSVMLALSLLIGAIALLLTAPPFVHELVGIARRVPEMTVEILR